MWNDLSFFCRKTGEENGPRHLIRKKYRFVCFTYVADFISSLNHSNVCYYRLMHPGIRYAHTPILIESGLPRPMKTHK